MKAISESVRDIRKDYTQEELHEHDVASSPYVQFQKWMDAAIESKVPEPNAMSLSTAVNGKPSTRIVLLRGFDENGFVFFTNYESRKGKEILANPYVCLNFFWPELERQIRIEGSISKTSAEVSDEYFNSRPRGNRLGAWASPQSEVIPNREEIERLTRIFEAKFPSESTIPRPPHWGGYLVKPELIEFWQGRASRLHDRICFRKMHDLWQIQRLAP
jgi:pyridoxamine 5'-phosphate oxidase